VPLIFGETTDKILHPNHRSDFCSALDIKVGFKSEKPQETTSGLSSSAQALLALSTENHTASQQPVVGAIEKKSDGLLW
jgi:hypothetical protein